MLLLGLLSGTASAQGNSTEQPEAGSASPGTYDNENGDKQPGDEDDEDKAGDPVDLATGAFTYTTPGLFIEGRGLPFALDFSYVSDRISIPTTTGTRWTHSYEEKLAFQVKERLIPIYQGPGGNAGGAGHGHVGGLTGEGPGEYITVITYDLFHYHDLRIDRYRQVEGDPSLWATEAGIFTKIVSIGDPIAPTAFLMRGANGDTVTFDLAETLNCPPTSPTPPVDRVVTFRPTRISDAAGNQLALEYEFIPSPFCVGAGHRRLTRINDTFGRPIDFHYDNQGWLEEVVDFTGRAVVLEHDNIGNLRALTTPAVSAHPSRTEYEYDPKVFGRIDSGHSIVAIIAPNEIADGSRAPHVQNEYDESGLRVVRQVHGGVNASGVAAGGVYDYIYEYQSTPIDHGWFQESSRTAVIDPNGNVTLAIFDIKQRKRLFYRFTGRLPHLAPNTSSSTNIADLLVVQPSVWPPNLAANHLIGGSAPIGAVLPSKPVSIRRQDYNADNLLVRDESQDFKMLFVYDPSADLFQRPNVLLEEKVSVLDPADKLTTAYAYEPLFNAVRASFDPRGLDPNFTPANGGVRTPGRYASYKLFDYQEGTLSEVQPLVSLWRIDVTQASAASVLGQRGISLAPIAFGVGDAAGNADGRADQRAGSTVRAWSSVRGFDDTIAGTFADQAVVELYRYNDFAQGTETVDALGVLSRTQYYSAADPTGASGVPSAAGGGLRARFENAVGTADVALWSFSYDALGRLADLTNPRGFTSSRSYDAVGHVTAETNAAGHVRQNVYDANYNLVETRYDLKSPSLNAAWLPTWSEVDLGDEVTTLTYDILGNVVAQTRLVPDAAQTLVTRMRYDRNGNRVLELTPESVNQPGAVESVVYDEHNRPWSRSVGGITEQFSALAANASIAELASLPVNPAGLSTTLTYYDGSRPTLAVDAEGHTTITEYDAFSRIARVVSPDGAYSTWTYDSMGLVMSQGRYEFDNDLVSHVRTSHDELGRQFQVDVFFASADGIPLVDGPLTAGDGYSTTRQKLDLRGDVVFQVDDQLGTTTHVRDARRRITRTTDALGNFTMTTYDRAGNAIYVEQHELAPSGASQVFRVWSFHDKLDRLYAVADEVGRADYWFYDSRGNVVLESDAKSNVTNLAMASLNVFGQHASLAGAPTVNYVGNTTFRVYDQANRLSETREVLRVGGLGGNPIATALSGDGFIRTQHLYDLNSRLIRSLDDEGSATNYEYDDHGRVRLVRYADGTEEITTYDRNSRMDHFTDANGVTVDHGYDSKGRLTSKTVLNGPSGTTFEHFDWDALDRVILASDDDSTVQREYDSLGNLTVELVNGRPVSIAHDSLGNPLSLTYPGGRAIEQAFDPLRRLDTVKSDTGALIADYDYVGTWRIHGRTLGNGVVTQPTYDSARDVREMRHTNASSQVLVHQKFQWDRAGNKVQRRNELSGLTQDFGYDSSYRMTVANRSGGGQPTSNVALSYDGGGDRTLVTGGLGAGTYSSNASDAPVHQYTTTPGRTLEHDDNGNLLSRRDSSTQQVVDSFVYDYRNQPIEYVAQDGRVYRYSYDVFGRRISKVRDALGSALTENYSYAPGDRLCEVQNGNGVTLATFVYGRRWIELLQFRVHVGASPPTYWYLDDEMHNVVALTNGSGSLVESFEYGEFGQLLNGTTLAPRVSSSTGSPFFFGGHFLDAESGLYHMRRRLMDPITGRFTTRDPKGIWADSQHSGNGYAYAGNNPWTYADPMGTLTWKDFEDLPEAGTRWGGPMLQVIAASIGIGADAYQFGESVINNATKFAKGKEQPGFVITALKAVFTIGLSELTTDRYDHVAANINNCITSTAIALSLVGAAGGAGGMFGTMTKNGKPVGPADIEVSNDVFGFKLNYDSSTGVASGTFKDPATGGQTRVSMQQMGTEGNEYLHVSVELEDGTQFQASIDKDGSRDVSITRTDTNGVIARFSVDANGKIVRNTLNRREAAALRRMSKEDQERKRLAANEAAKNNKGDTMNSKTHKSECLRGDTTHWGSASGNPRPGSSGDSSGGGDGK